MKLQSRRQLKMQSSEGLTYLQDLLPNSPGDYWPLASVLTMWALHKTAHHMAVCFPKRNWLKRDKVCFYNLISDVKHHHFCHILLSTQINPGVMWEGTIQECEYQGSENIRDLLKLVFLQMDWTPASWCHLMPDCKLEPLCGISCWEFSNLLQKNIKYQLNASVAYNFVLFCWPVLYPGKFFNWGQLSLL